jgi:anti-sigma-K factor RskA
MTTAQHDALRDDLAAYALGALEPDAVSRVRAHLSVCTDCQQLYAEYQGVLELLPLGLPATRPSPTSRARLLAASQRESTTQQATPAVGRLSAWWSRTRVVGVAFASALAVLVGVTVWQVWGTSDEPSTAALVEEIRNDPDAAVWPMVGSDNAPDATGNLFLEPGRTEAALIANGLPQPPTGRQYQFWFVRPDESRVSGGVFEVDRAGSAIALLSAPEEFSDGWSCGVSEEPSGGSEQPTGRNILRADYANYDDYNSAPNP